MPTVPDIGVPELLIVGFYRAAALRAGQGRGYWLFARQEYPRVPPRVGGARDEAPDALRVLAAPRPRRRRPNGVRRCGTTGGGGISPRGRSCASAPSAAARTAPTRSSAPLRHRDGGRGLGR